MKIVEYAIYELLKNLAGGKVFAMRAPAGETGPFIIFQRTDSERWRAINGPSGVVRAYIQIDCYAAGIYEAKELGADVESLLDGYMGEVYYGTNSPRDSVKIGGITMQNDLDIFDQTDQPNLFRNSASYVVNYNQ